MTVMLVDRAGKLREQNIPGHLHEFRVPVFEKASALIRADIELKSLEYKSIVFRPTGDHMMWLTRRGVCSLPVWRQVE